MLHRSGDPTANHGGALAYEPALDGLRGAAVLAVLLFHGGVGWAVGGYLGVSAFFTLSGFLITSVVLARREQEGRVRLTDFWIRRARRLLPAAWLCLAGVIVFGLTIAPPTSLDTLPGDVLASLGYLTNWRLVATGSSYDALFSAPSPVTHMWSLAIEEQFYLVFPLVAALVLARGGRPRRLAAVLAVGAVASTVAMVALYDPSAPTSRSYYGTDVRAAEILVGAVAAALWWGRGERSRDDRAPCPPWATLGASALVVAGLAAWATVPSTSRWLYQGGFTVHALGVAAAVLAIQRPGPLARVLAVEPLRLLGLISYGVYLYHWPIFLVLTEDRIGIAGPSLLVVRISVTIAVAIASYVLVEAPIRTRRALVGPKALVAGATAVVVLVVALIPIDPPRSATIAAPPPPVAPTPEATPDSGRVVAGGGASAANLAPPRVAVFGDSTAMMLAGGLAWWADQTGELEWGGGVMVPGCGLARGGEVRRLGVPGPVDCVDWTGSWTAWNEVQQIDVAVVLVGPWEVLDRRLPGDDQWRAPGDPIYDDYFRAEVRDALRTLTSTGAAVVWLTHPPIEPGRAVEPRPQQPPAEADPARMDRVNEIIAEEVGRWPGGDASVVDLAAYFDGLPGGPMNPEYRPDGVHISIHMAPHVSNWLGPEIIERCCARPSDATSAARPLRPGH